MVRLTVLGSGDAFGAGGRLHSAYLVEAPGQTFLLDCGPSILQSMKQLGRDPGAIDFVVLSHHHGDHFGGLPFLFMEYRYLHHRTRPLTVYGPPGTERRVRTNSGTPISSSSAWICCDSGGCVIDSRCAARPKCNSSATVTK